MIGKLEGIKRNIKILTSKFIKLGSEPDFIIIGAQKAGTTSLYNYIREYGQNFISPFRKELYFFSENFDKGIDWYKALFSLRKGNNITGEATPDYLFHPKSPERMVEFFPNIKLIVMLRNPVERAYSQYKFQNNTTKTKAYDPLSFEDAVKKEEKRINQGEKRAKLTGEFSYVYKYYSYKKRGIYYDQLKNWFRYFPKDQFLILKSKDFFENTKLNLKEVFSFLDLKFKNNKELEFKEYNKTSYSEMKKETKNYLESFYRPYNEKLNKLLDREFGWNN